WMSATALMCMWLSPSSISRKLSSSAESRSKCEYAMSPSVASDEQEANPSIRLSHEHTIWPRIPSSRKCGSRRLPGPPSPRRHRTSTRLGTLLGRGKGVIVAGHYERLSALDASFLQIEDASSHMHVGVALLFDAAPLRVAHGGLDMERIRGYVESRLHLIPRYRQRLTHIPLEPHPAWVADDPFNLS